MRFLEIDLWTDLHDSEPNLEQVIVPQRSFSIFKPSQLTIAGKDIKQRMNWRRAEKLNCDVVG